jgi:TctA family transporter
MTATPEAQPPRPINPLVILALAIVLPGAGQVFNREPVRGLIFVFFMVLLGGFTLQTAAPEVSIVGKLAGGLFVYAVSIYDAYKKARIRYELWRFAVQKA